jgi:hypothetical protein
MTELDDDLAAAVAKLDAWFETMRCPGGYGGPVVHWWRDSLFYTGPGLDWRYEGIILGYLNLYKKTGERRWLNKGLRGGYDLVRGQLKNGNFRNSSFEANPKSGGTPHEAAVCVALLSLAKVLKAEKDPRYREFLFAARKNIEEYYLKHLWDDTLGMFRDSLHHRSFVPNKSATLVEAFFLLAELINDNKLIEKYVIPTVDLILKHQILDKKSDLYGAIYQVSTVNKGKFKFTGKFFPFYVSRCVSALLQAGEFTGDEKYIHSANAIVDFIVKFSDADGNFPQVVYFEGNIARSPQWVAGAGDILRTIHLISKSRFKKQLRWLLGGLDDCGGIRTAYGFVAQAGSEKYEGVPDFRDLLHVCGWNDKAFRLLTEILPENSEVPKPECKEFVAQCTFKNRELTFLEDEKSVRLRDNDREIYRWRKGNAWAEADVKYLL